MTGMGNEPPATFAAELTRRPPLVSVAIAALALAGACVVVALNHFSELLDHLTDHPSGELTGAATAAVVFLSLSMPGVVSWQLPVIVAIVAAMLGVTAGERGNR